MTQGCGPIKTLLSRIEIDGEKIWGMCLTSVLVGEHATVLNSSLKFQLRMG